MKSLVKTTTTLTLILCSTFLFAQSMLGIRGGVNLATYNEIADGVLITEVEKDYITGLDIAVFGKLNIATTFFSIQPELHWIQKGVRYTREDVENMDLEMEYRYNYMEIPLLARADFGTTRMQVYVVAGPTVGYASDGTYTGNNVPFVGPDPVKSGDYEADLVWDDDYANDDRKDNRIDIGAAAGLGVDVALGPVAIIVDARYNFDFNDKTLYEETPKPEPTKIYNRGITLTAGIGIPIGR